MWDHEDLDQGRSFFSSAVKLKLCSLLCMNLRMFQGRSLCLEGGDEEGSRGSVREEYIGEELEEIVEGRGESRFTYCRQNVVISMKVKRHSEAE